MIPVRFFSFVFPFSECSVIVSVPLPQLSRSRTAKAGLMEILLEEWILRPLLTLASVRPTAELYRLKRKIMDGPFTRKPPFDLLSFSTFMTVLLINFTETVLTQSVEVS